MNFFQKLLAVLKGMFSAKAVVATAVQQVDASTSTQTTTTTVAPAELLEADVQKAIDIVNKVKDAMASPVAVLITDIIPGNIDDVIRKTLVDDLPVVAAGLTFFKEVLSNDRSTALNQVLNAIKFSDKPNIDAFYHTLSAKVLQIISGGTISWSKAVIAVEYVLKEAILNNVDTANGAAVLESAIQANAAGAAAMPDIQTNDTGAVKA